jgi:hypothetical protein
MKDYCKCDQHAVVYTAISDICIENIWVIRTLIPSLVNKFYFFIVTTFEFAPYKGKLSDIYRQFLKKYQISNIGYMTHPMMLRHCGRVTQICVLNTVKLGACASSP